VLITAELIESDMGFLSLVADVLREIKGILPCAMKSPRRDERWQLKLLEARPADCSGLSQHESRKHIRLTKKPPPGDYFTVCVGRGKARKPQQHSLIPSSAIKLDEKYAPVWALRSRCRHDGSRRFDRLTTEGFGKAGTTRGSGPLRSILSSTFSLLASGQDRDDVRIGTWAAANFPLAKRRP